MRSILLLASSLALVMPSITSFGVEELQPLKFKLQVKTGVGFSKKLEEHHIPRRKLSDETRLRPSEIIIDRKRSQSYDDHLERAITNFKNGHKTLNKFLSPLKSVLSGHETKHYLNMLSGKKLIHDDFDIKGDIDPGKSRKAYKISSEGVDFMLKIAIENLGEECENETERRLLGELDGLDVVPILYEDATIGQKKTSSQYIMVEYIPGFLLARIHEAEDTDNLEYYLTLNDDAKSLKKYMKAKKKKLAEVKEHVTHKYAYTIGKVYGATFDAVKGKGYFLADNHWNNFIFHPEKDQVFCIDLGGGVKKSIYEAILGMDDNAFIDEEYDLELRKKIMTSFMDGIYEGMLYKAGYSPFIYASMTLHDLTLKTLKSGLQEAKKFASDYAAIIDQYITSSHFKGYDDYFMHSLSRLHGEEALNFKVFDYWRLEPTIRKKISELKFSESDQEDSREELEHEEKEVEKKGDLSNQSDQESNKNDLSQTSDEEYVLNLGEFWQLFVLQGSGLNLTPVTNLNELNQGDTLLSLAEDKEYNRYLNHFIFHKDLQKIEALNKSGVTLTLVLPVKVKGHQWCFGDTTHHLWKVKPEDLNTARSKAAVISLMEKIIAIMPANELQAVKGEHIEPLAEEILQFIKNPEPAYESDNDIIFVDNGVDTDEYQTLLKETKMDRKISVERRDSLTKALKIHDTIPNEMNKDWNLFLKNLDSKSSIDYN